MNEPQNLVQRDSVCFGGRPLTLKHLFSGFCATGASWLWLQRCFILRLTDLVLVTSLGLRFYCFVSAMLQLFPASTGVLGSPVVRCFFHQKTNTCSYIVQCPKTSKAAILDSVLDYASNSGKVSTEYADTLLKEVKNEGLNVEWILDTHVHADHITGMAYLKKQLPNAKTAISERITDVQKHWAAQFDWPEFDCSGSQWDYLLADDSGESATSVASTTVFHSTDGMGADAYASGSEGAALKKARPVIKEIVVGELTIRPIPTPGHTPACMTFLIGDTLFTGDAIFQPDFGTARCDFPGGSSHDLFHSISKLYAHPDHFRIFVGHDYPPASRGVTFFTDVASQKSSNKFIKTATTKDEFVSARNARDAELDAPNLLYPSLQFNINAGSLPPAGPSGKRFVKVPLKIMTELDF